MDFEGVLSTKTLHLIPFQAHENDQATSESENEMKICRKSDNFRSFIALVKSVDLQRFERDA